ncbi:MAG: hypothetical protein ACI33M_10505 [Lysinibacillus sp.]
MRLYEMEYKGLNLLDEVCTIEIALDVECHTVHIFDTNHVVEPTYHFERKEYELSEGFFKLAQVLSQKYFFVEKRSQNLEKWIDSLTWTFYSSNQSIKCFQGNMFSIVPLKIIMNQDEQSLIDRKLYPKYVNRLIAHS